MKNSNIAELNIILTNTLEYMEVLQEMAEAITAKHIKERLKDFAEIAKEESQQLTLIISNKGGDVESTDRLTDQQAIGWAPKPLPNPENIQDVLNYLIKIERKKEDDYNHLRSREDIEREDINRLYKHKKKSEEMLRFYQSELLSLENKN